MDVYLITNGIWCGIHLPGRGLVKTQRQDKASKSLYFLNRISIRIFMYLH